MHPAPIGIALIVTLLLAAFWRRMKERTEDASAPPHPTPTPRAASRIPDARSHTDIRQLLQQARETLQTRLRAAGMSLQLELPADPLPVVLDRPGMQEVFAQIVELACSAMPPGSTLRVLGRIDGAHAVVNFMDASPGTDAPRLGHCFDAASTRNDGDAIANVALCAQIVSDHRGRIYAAPSPLGSLGITLRLPLRLQVHTISPRSSRKVGAAPLAQEIADGREITPD